MSDTDAFSSVASLERAALNSVLGLRYSEMTDVQRELASVLVNRGLAKWDVTIPLKDVFHSKLIRRFT